jgi:hypothetical protein
MNTKLYSTQYKHIMNNIFDMYWSRLDSSLEMQNIIEIGEDKNDIHCNIKSLIS